MKVFHRSVAFPAGNFTVDMPLMIEQHMLGHIVYLHPGGGCLRVEILVLLLDPGMFFDDVVVAVQTLFHRRNSWKVRVSHIRVTVLALDLLDAAVHIVAEGDRLFRSERRYRPQPENIDEGDRGQNGDQC